MNRFLRRTEEQVKEQVVVYATWSQLIVLFKLVT